MNIQTKKYNLIHQIIQVNDELLIDTLKSLLDFGLKYQSTDEGEAVSDFWDEMSDEHKIKVEKSLQQMEEGIGTPHNEVMAKFRNKYQK